MLLMKNGNLADLSSIDVAILCGGQGSRLKPVLSDRPKVLARVGARTFLDILLRSLLPFGFVRVVLCVGYLGEQVKTYVREQCYSNVVFSDELQPLGTGGALRNALPLLSDPFLAMNGDSVCDVDFASFLDFHLAREALLTIVVCSGSTLGGKAGNISLDDNGRVTSFVEGGPVGSGVSAGIYLMQQDIFDYAPDRVSFSLERDLFPSAVGSRRCFGFSVSGTVFDIGDPVRYERACQLFKEE